MLLDLVGVAAGLLGLLDLGLGGLLVGRGRRREGASAGLLEPPQAMKRPSPARRGEVRTKDERVIGPE